MPRIFVQSIHQEIQQCETVASRLQGQLWWSVKETHGRQGRIQDLVCMCAWGGGWGVTAWKTHENDEIQHF